MMTALEKAKQHAHLIDIRRGGRKNIFIFQRGEKIIKIETMGLLSDDIKTWKDELIR